MAGKRTVGCVSIRELREAEVDVKEEEIEFLDYYIERMESVGWG
jgi:hypothetical protein